jgi:hypothetical protein
MKHWKMGPFLIPILVTTIDVAWAWWLSALAKPMLFRASGLSELEASRAFDNVLEPRLWIAYVVVLAAQLIWVNLIVPRGLSLQRLRRLWWLGFAISLFTAVLIRYGLALSPAASLLLLIVPIGDLLLLYWLATRLLTPQPQRSVIPGWW